MIIRTAKVKMFEGDEIEIPIPKGKQIWELTVSRSCLSINGSAGERSTIATIHVKRETLERAGLLPVVDTKGESESQKETTEQLLTRLLASIGIIAND